MYINASGTIQAVALKTNGTRSVTSRDGATCAGNEPLTIVTVIVNHIFVQPDQSR